MKRYRQTRRAILKKLEASEYPLTFRQFSMHGIGGFEVSEHPNWSDEGAYELDLMIEDMLVVQSTSNGDEPWLGLGEDEPYRETYVRLSSSGHEARDQENRVYWIYANIRDNIPTIVVSVLTAMIIAWLTGQ